MRYYPDLNGMLSSAMPTEWDYDRLQKTAPGLPVKPAFRKAAIAYVILPEWP
jgi:hypothetical protein